jgi:hypothetical protein
MVVTFTRLALHEKRNESGIEVEGGAPHTMVSILDLQARSASLAAPGGVA